MDVTFSFLCFYRDKRGWYLALLQKDISPADKITPTADKGWCFLALVWLHQYHRLKLFFNQDA